MDRGFLELLFEDLSTWKLVTIVSKLIYNLLRGRIQPTYIGVTIHLLSTMDIPVVYSFMDEFQLSILFFFQHQNLNPCNVRLFGDFFPMDFKGTPECHPRKEDHI